MDDDTPKLDLKLNPAIERYAALYPNMPARIAAILSSKDLAIRRRAETLFGLARASEERRHRRLVERWRLTKTEARLALHLIDGGDIASYAKAAGVSAGTARGQLKSIFSKVGVSRQSALVRLGQHEI
jgi:DNA-binding CsgD family transcriptional regulator